MMKKPHFDTSKNICEQMAKWKMQFIANQIEKDIPYYQALVNSSIELEKIVDSQWSDPIFREKLADDMIDEASKDTETLKEIFEMSKPGAKKKMDDAMDKYSKGLISKTEMEKVLNTHSIIYKEIDWSKD